jgi:aspartyl-tRNA(Asn)/glutamyl-tRNA(Gln) amidotransferase subunit A
MKISNRPTIQEIHNLYRTAQATPSQVTKYFLDFSKSKDQDIHSVLRWVEERALIEAKRCDDLLMLRIAFDGLLAKYPLFGIPYNLKDNILVEGEIATSASKIIDNYKSTYSSTVYKRLYEAGGIMISQSNLDEWAVGSSTENSAFGASKNPYDTSRVPGGSSGGPAANVGSAQSVFALGSDTGGSIRQPAAFCNVVGVKPTYGLVPRYGVMPLASSLDQVGPFTNNVEDNLTVLKVLTGHIVYDQTSVENIVDWDKSKPIYNIGVPEEYFIDGADPIIMQQVKSVIDSLRSLGHNIVNINLPLTKYGLAVYYTTMTVETASNLQRFDGIRFGSQISKDPIFEQFYSIRDTNFGDEPKRRIMLGTFASSSGYYDAYYNKACMVKELMSKDFEKAFKTVDLIICPTAPEFPFKFGDKVSDPVKMYLSDVLVYGANLCKIPSISIPLNLSNVDGTLLPSGIQLMANEYNEGYMYSLAQTIQNKIINI